MLAALKVMLLSTTALFGRLANGVYFCPLATQSQWISSASTTTRCFRQISPMRSRSACDQQLPVGFCGLQRMKEFVSDADLLLERLEVHREGAVGVLLEQHFFLVGPARGEVAVEAVVGRRLQQHLRALRREGLEGGDEAGVHAHRDDGLRRVETSRRSGAVPRGDVLEERGRHVEVAPVLVLEAVLERLVIDGAARKSMSAMPMPTCTASLPNTRSAGRTSPSSCRTGCTACRSRTWSRSPTGWRRDDRRGAAAHRTEQRRHARVLKKRPAPQPVVLRHVYLSASGILTRPTWPDGRDA